MLRIVRISALVAPMAVHAIACTSSKLADPATKDGGATENPTADGGENVTADGGESLGDCVPYAPAEISGTKAGTFASADEIVKIVLPETDVGGGLLKVTYVADQQPLVGSIWLGEGEKKDVPRHETSAFGPGVSEATAVVYFRLVGKKRYEIGVKPFSFDEGGKNGYTVSYSYESQSDCYEPNDTLAAAKRIPLNTTITASLHTGIGPDDLDLVSATGDDWYTFELTTEKVVQLKANLPGKDGADGKNSAMFTILTADGATAASCSGQGSFETDPVAATETVETCEGPLASGKYFVKLAHFTSQYGATSVNVAPDKSWNTPYTFTINAK